MALLKCFRHYRRDRRAEAYCLCRLVWNMRLHFTSQTRLLARPLLSRHMLLFFLGGPLLDRWRRSVEHRQAALARQREH